jgi:cell wall-associated NlpC family hydrolase
MENINKYIGIKHKFNGDTFDGADCIGLCRLFYREHGWPETFTDGRIIEHDWESKEPLRLLLYLRKYFDENKDISKLRFGDIVLFNIGGDSHLGIYLEYGKVLAMQAPVQEGKTTSTIYPRSLWQHSFKAGFRRR